MEFICGIRWLEWAESFSLDTQTPGPGFTNNWSSRTVNNLYGGQIGIDTLLYSTSWLHVESVLKGGAYWNDALSNAVAAIALFAAMISPDLWLLDPVGAILISMYIIYSWYETGKEQIEYLPQFLGPDVKLGSTLWFDMAF